MFKKIVILLLVILPCALWAQQTGKGRPTDKKSDKGNPKNATTAKDGQPKAAADTIATIDMYKIVTLERDTIIADTAISLKKYYEVNYLRKDNFGLLPFANIGQTYNTLYYGLTRYSPFPEMGFSAKHFPYMQAEDIKYYNVATPFTELFYRSVVQQGQTLDAFITVNTSKNLNLFAGYKGLRSLGDYINQLTSNGNFRLGGSYNTTDMRYQLKLHFTAQDFSNQENGGITNQADFESGEDPYTNRERLDVYLKDATSLLKGNRYFIDHTFRLNKTNPNSIVFHHRFTYENKFFQFTETENNNRFGASYTSAINNKTRYNKMYNLLGAAYTNEKFGTVEFYIEDFNYNYYYHSAIVGEDGAIAIPNSLSDRIDNYGAKYSYQKDKWKGTALVSNSITNQSLSNIDLAAEYSFDERNKVSARYNKMNRLPNHIYNLYQSDYKAYNWYNDFKNEKINSFEFEAKTQWVNAKVQYQILNDRLYFKEDPTAEHVNLNPKDVDTLYVKPYQYGNTINYLSVRVDKEFKFWKFGLDNSILYQNVQQSDNVLNVPEFLTRNTFYYSDELFKKALGFQAGISFEYFTSYYGNTYNPLIGEFYIQDKQKIGNFPLIDLFINAKIKEFRMFFKAEHINGSFSGYNYYSAPGYPYRDFTIRFGIIWDFFS